MANGLICELQLGVKAIDQAKHSGGHKVPDVIRMLEGMTERMPQQDKDLAEFRAFQEELYEEAGEDADSGADLDQDRVEKWNSDARMAKVREYKRSLGA
jgi:hypothetical protein